MGKTKHYKLASEFSKFPGGRFRVHGPKSGEEFRDDVLLPLLQEFNHITIDLTGASGFGSSFLDESFGELGKRMGLGTVKSRISLIANDDPHLIDRIWEKVRLGEADEGR